MRNAWLWFGLFALAGVFSSARAEAQIGDTSTSLPGVIRVASPVSAPKGVAVAGALGYGFTEAQPGESGSHTRILGVLSASLRPMDWLAFALRLDGRYDRHPDDGMGTDDGWVGDPRLYVRAGTTVAGPLSLGGQVVLWLPGADAPSVVFGATSLDFQGLASLHPAGSGLDLDRQRWLSPRPERRVGDERAPAAPG